MEITALNIERNCVFCGRKILGRTDKKFCDDTCRNNHHYKIQKCDNDIVKKINTHLQRNRNILKSLSNKYKTVVSKKSLTDNDFDFSLMTGMYKTKKGNEYIVVYDYAYKFIDGENILLLKFIK